MAETQQPAGESAPTTAELEQLLADLDFFLNLEELESLPLEQEVAAEEAGEGEDDGDE